MFLVLVVLIAVPACSVLWALTDLSTAQGVCLMAFATTALPMIALAALATVHVAMSRRPVEPRLA